MEEVYFVIFLVIVGYVCYKGVKAYENSSQERQKKINSLKGQINELMRSFEGSLSNFFSSTCNYNTYQSGRDNYENLYSSLKKAVDDMEKVNQQLTYISQSDDESGLIAKCKQLISDLQKFTAELNKFPYTRLMDNSNYGKINKV